MSIKLMSLVWQTELPLNQKAALLALCDWANDDGASLHPSVFAVAVRLTCSERTAQRLLKDLIETQWLAVVGNLHGGKPGTTRKYRINVRKLKDEAEQCEARRQTERSLKQVECGDEPDPFAPDDTGDKLTGVTNQAQTGDKQSTGGVTSKALTGDTHVTQSTKEPSKNHQGSVKAQALGLDGVDDQLLDDWEKVRAAKRAGKATVAAVKGLKREAAKAGLTDAEAIEVCCANGWQGFRAEWYVRDTMPTAMRPARRSGPEHKYAAAAAAIFDGVFE